MSTNELLKKLHKNAQAFDREQAAEVAKTARELCPRSNNNSPGHVHLQDTIRVIEDKETGAIEVVAGDAENLDVVPAPVVEYGTHRMPARPFMTPATMMVELKEGERLAKKRDFYK